MRHPHSDFCLAPPAPPACGRGKGFYIGELRHAGRLNQHHIRLYPPQKRDECRHKIAVQCTADTPGAQLLHGVATAFQQFCIQTDRAEVVFDQCRLFGRQSPLAAAFAAVSFCLLRGIRKSDRALSFYITLSAGKVRRRCFARKNHKQTANTQQHDRTARLQPA